MCARSTPGALLRPWERKREEEKEEEEEEEEERERERERERVDTVPPQGTLGVPQGGVQKCC